MQIIVCFLPIFLSASLSPHFNSSLYIKNIKPLQHLMYVANVFSHFVICILTGLMVGFWGCLFCWFMSSNLSIFYHIRILNHSYKTFPCAHVIGKFTQVFLKEFNGNIFFIFRSQLHLEFILAYGVIYITTSNFLFSRGPPAFPAQRTGKLTSVPAIREASLTVFEISYTVRVRLDFVCDSTTWSIPAPVPHYFNFRGFVIPANVWWSYSPKQLLFLRDFRGGYYMFAFSYQLKY